MFLCSGVLRGSLLRADTAWCYNSGFLVSVSMMRVLVGSQYSPFGLSDTYHWLYRFGVKGLAVWVDVGLSGTGVYPWSL